MRNLSNLYLLIESTLRFKYSRYRELIINIRWKNITLPLRRKRDNFENGIIASPKNVPL